jgi:hypothetical protein
MAKKINQKLWIEIKEELHEDVGCLDDLESWSETCLDCPSNTLEELLEKIPDELNELYFDKINNEISKIVESVSRDFEDEDEEDEDDGE